MISWSVILLGVYKQLIFVMFINSCSPVTCMFVDDLYIGGSLLCLWRVHVQLQFCYVCKKNHEQSNTCYILVGSWTFGILLWLFKIHEQSIFCYDRFWVGLMSIWSSVMFGRVHVYQFYCYACVGFMTCWSPVMFMIGSWIDDLLVCLPGMNDDLIFCYVCGQYIHCSSPVLFVQNLWTVVLLCLRWIHEQLISCKLCLLRIPGQLIFYYIWGGFMNSWSSLCQQRFH